MRDEAFVREAARARDGETELEPARFYRELRRSSRCPLTLGMLLVGLDVFAELGLLTRGDTPSGVRAAVIPGAPKANLNDSRILASLR